MNLMYIKNALIQFQRCVKLKKSQQDMCYGANVQDFSTYKTAKDTCLCIEKELERLGECVVYEYFGLGEQLDMHSKPDVADLEPIIQEVMHELSNSVLKLMYYCCFEKVLYLRSGLQFMTEWHSCSVADWFHEKLVKVNDVLEKQLFWSIWFKNGQEKRPEGIPKSHYWWDVVWRENDNIFMKILRQHRQF